MQLGMYIRVLFVSDFQKKANRSTNFTITFNIYGAAFFYL